MDFFDTSILVEDFGIFLRLLIAAVLTGILGWERETTGKAAGLRTHILVGVGAALFVVIGFLPQRRVAPHLADQMQIIGACRRARLDDVRNVHRVPNI